MNDLSGKTLGFLQVGEPIGQGPMATVYKAYDPARERFVALKVWRGFDKGPTFWDYFPGEMQAIAQLSHPHLLPIYDFGEQGGRVWIVMEYARGGTLQQRFSPGSLLPVREALRLLAQACAALVYVHQEGMLHRNLKPQNLLLRSDQDVLLSDFGIEELWKYRGTLLIKSTQTGPPHQYLAPEQLTGSPVASRRSEVYALGVVLYQAVTGQVPFDDILKRLNEPLPPPRQFAPDLPPLLEQVIIRALEKDPDHRFQSALEMSEALEHIREQLPDV